MENQVTQLLKAMVKPDYTACSYAFMQNGKIVCADAIGVINKINNQPITTDCTFNVCSISKIYCTVCVMQLVDEGLIQLEDKVADILPEFTMKDERYKEYIAQNKIRIEEYTQIEDSYYIHAKIPSESKSTTDNV